MFDILDDDAEEDPEEEVPEDQRLKGSRGFVGQGPGPRACNVLPGQGKRKSRKRPIRKFGFRIEVRSERIDESAFLADKNYFRILEVVTIL